MSTHPSSRPPAGIPQGNNTKYAVVAILLVLGMGGLFAWKVLNNQAPQPTQVVIMPSASTSATAATTKNSKLDDIPPPPPDEERPEAGPGPKVVYTGGPPSGCDKACSGSATPELTGAIQVKGAQARRCYNQALATDSTLKGHVSISVKIGGSGTVCSASVTSNDMGTPAVANCAANIFRSASYPAPKGGCAEFNVPLSFVPQGQ
jgi:hypothetical protein